MVYRGCKGLPTNNHWKKRNYLKGKVDELGGKKRKAISGGSNSDRISLETAGEQKPSA